MKKIILAALIASTFASNAIVTQNGAPAGAAIDSSTCTGLDGTGGLTDTVSFAGAGPITDANVNVDITHSWRGDLQMHIDYNGTTVILAADHGSSASTDNYFATFDTEAGAACSDVTNCGNTTDNTTCFSDATRSTCQPDDALTVFNGMAGNLGAWTFSVCDDAGGDQGTFDAWSVTLDGAPGSGLPVELMNLEVE